MTGDGPKMVHFGPKWPNMTGLSTLQSSPKGLKRDPNGQPKCFWLFRTPLGPSGSFWTISNKKWYFAPKHLCKTLLCSELVRIFLRSLSRPWEWVMTKKMQKVLGSLECLPADWLRFLLTQSQQRTLLSWFQTWKTSYAVIGLYVLTLLLNAGPIDFEVFLQLSNHSLDEKSNLPYFSISRGSPFLTVILTVKLTRVWLSRILVVKISVDMLTCGQ